MKFTYKTTGTCSKQIEIELENDTIKNVKFSGGCSGNTQGLSAMVKGLNTDDVILKLKGIKCANKSTSCPDQLAKALESVKTNPNQS